MEINEMEAEMQKIQDTLSSNSKITTPEPKASALSAEPKSQSERCPKHGDYLSSRFWLINTWSHWSVCPRCKEEDERQAELKIINEAERAKERALKQRYDSALIPPRFSGKTLADFISANDQQTAIKQFCIEYAANFKDKLGLGAGIIFSGTTGTGKTHLACGIANQIITDNHTALFIGVVKAIRRVKETYGKKGETESEAIKWFLKPDLLILDEVGVQFGSDTEKLILFEILNERYENFRPTIIISNLSAENLREYIGDRIMDRMRENGGKFIKFTWESHRMQQLEKQNG